MKIEESRHSVRLVPIGSNEEMAVLNCGMGRFLAKILDLSEGGTCVYLVDEDVPVEADSIFTVNLFHSGHILEVCAKVARKTGRLIGLAFVGVTPDIATHLRAKLIRLEVEWMRMGPVN